MFSPIADPNSVCKYGDGPSNTHASWIMAQRLVAQARLKPELISVNGAGISSRRALTTRRLFPGGTMARYAWRGRWSDVAGSGRPDVGVRQPQPRVLRGRLHNVLYDDHDDHILILVSRLDSLYTLIIST